LNLYYDPDLKRKNYPYCVEGFLDFKIYFNGIEFTDSSIKSKTIAMVDGRFTLPTEIKFQVAELESVFKKEVDV